MLQVLESSSVRESTTLITIEALLNQLPEKSTPPFFVIFVVTAVHQWPWIASILFNRYHWDQK